MFKMRDHDVADYAALRHMDATDVGDLDDDDRACLEDLGQYLVSAEASERFAIWLLHKHFEPAPGEVFVESLDADERRTRTSPAGPAELSADRLQPTSVRFDPSADSGVGLIGMEFATLADFGSAAPISSEDEPVLAGIAERLRTHDKSDRFGARLIRDAIDISDDELLMESCDEANRTLVCDVRRLDDNRSTKSIETTWQWKPVDGETGRAVIQKCLVECEVWTDGEHTYTGCR